MYALKTILISALIGVVLVAGIFALMQVDRATTVHNTIIGSTSNIFTIELTDATPAAADIYTLNCDEDYAVIGITLDAAAEAGDGNDEDITITAGGEDVAAFDDVDAGANVLSVGLGGTSLSQAIPADRDDDVVFTLAGSFAGDEDPTMKIAVLIDNNGSCTFTETT